MGIMNMEQREENLRAFSNTHGISALVNLH